MGSIPEFERGTTVTVKSTISDDTGAVVEPDNKDAFITIRDLSTDEVMVQKTTMENVSDTQYEYDWQTTEGMTEGEYEVQTEADVSSDTYMNRDRIELVDIIVNR